MQAGKDFFRYLPVDEASMRWGAYVTGAGRVTISPCEEYPPRGYPALYDFDWQRGRTLPEFQIILVSEGSGEFESEKTGRVEFHDSALMLLFPDVWHRYRPLSKVGWTERWISFNGELVHRLMNIGCIDPHLALTKPRNVERLTNVFENLLDRILLHSVQLSVQLSLQVLDLISDAVAHRVNNPSMAAERRMNEDSSSMDPIVGQALELIWSHCHHGLTVSDIARQLPTTRRTLDRKFAEAMGHSVLEEINFCRLNRAKRLLLETSLPIKTVAYLAGFSNAERMRVVFVTRENISPTAFRKQSTHKSNGSRQLDYKGRDQLLCKVTEERITDGEGTA